MRTDFQARCPVCGMKVRMPAGQVRIVECGVADRVRFDCDDCGTVTRTVPFSTLVQLVGAGMPPSFVEEDVYGFQMAMAWRDDLAAVAEQEGASA